MQKSEVPNGVERPAVCGVNLFSLRNLRMSCPALGGLDGQAGFGSGSTLAR
jgi:hypothetical protein